MKWSLYLGKPWGIKLFIHWTFLILIGWVLISQLSQGSTLQQALWPVGFILAVFACVTFHEYGHALAARKYNVSTQKITLLPIGGIASLEKIPDKPSEELVVAAAGPLVNVVIAILIYLGLILSGTPVIFPTEMNQMNISNFFPMLMLVNIILVVFNLIPAFPMDGGRMLRALLAMRMDKIIATRWASSIGQFFAILFAFWGLMAGNPFIIFIAVFIYLGAQAEYQNMASVSLLSGFKVRDITMHKFTALHPYERLSHAIQIMLDSQEERFVVLSDQQVVGTLTKRNIIEGLNNHGPDLSIQQAMNKDIQTVTEETPLEEAMNVFQQKGISLLPVMRETQFIGLLDMDNIHEFMLIQSALRKNNASLETV